MMVFLFNIKENFVGKGEYFNPFILNSSKLKGLADDNFKFDENGRKFSKIIENSVGKCEIAVSSLSFLSFFFRDPQAPVEPQDCREEKVKL